MKARPPDRDVGAFEVRATTYEDGWKGRMHGDIAPRTAELAVSAGGRPTRVLDVGCGTGLVLRQVAARLPRAEVLVGIDPAPTMVEVARRTGTDARLRFECGVAEHLPFEDASFDLVVSATSFDHWKDQRAGLAECARVLAPGAPLVLTDLISLWLFPATVLGHRDRARTRRRVRPLLREAGFSAARWHRLYALLLMSVVATR